MTLSYVYCNKITSQTIAKIDECIRKINPNHRTIEINKDEIVFYFDDYTLLLNHLGTISHLINGGIDYKPSNIWKKSENEYFMFVWS